MAVEARKGTDRKGSKTSHDAWYSSAAMREVIESIVVAFVLAFLFRTFEAEAFVIPTGSMAPTLMGRHKDVQCPKCSYPYQVSASDEVDPHTNKPHVPPVEVVSGTCPVCGFTMDITADRGNPSFKGDRILVAKFPYEFTDPQRWDVAVFMYPGGAKTNYIKRVIGLPGETIRISHGNIHVRARGAEGFAIARKPPAKVLAMMQPVHDNDYQARELAAAGWPPRWQASDEESSGGWTSEDGKAFRTDGSGRRAAWLAYRHLDPSYADWQAIASGQRVPPPPPQLISDFTAYNTGGSRVVSSRRSLLEYGASYLGMAQPADQVGLHWVGDLIVEFALEVQGNAGLALVDLVEGGGISAPRLTWRAGRPPCRSTAWRAFAPRRRRKSALRARTRSASPMWTTSCCSG